jgi:YidC/Oxa1 family membrane protein insertase
MTVEPAVNRFVRLVPFFLLFALLLSSCGGVHIDPNTGQEVYTPGLFEPLAYPLRLAMIFFHNLLTPLGVAYAWGWAIILVAVLIRILLLPLGIRQMRLMRVAQAKMKALQPELEVIKKKYAKDRQKLQEEQMRLYQKHGITQAQMAGCLPTLLQMPILFAFYYALLGLIVQSDFKQDAPFYFIPDLAHPSYIGGLGWLTDNFSLGKLAQPDVWPYLVLPAVLAVSQYVLTKMTQTSQPTPDPNNPAANMMNQMAILMTVMFVFFSLQVPSGMSLYWVVGNILAIAQQYYVNRQAHRWDQDAAALAAATMGGEVETELTAEAAPAVSSDGKAVAVEKAGPAPARASAAAPTTPRRKRRRRR